MIVTHIGAIVWVMWPQFSVALSLNFVIGKLQQWKWKEQKKEENETKKKQRQKARNSNLLPYIRKMCVPSSIFVGLGRGEEVEREAAKGNTIHCLFLVRCTNRQSLGESMEDGSAWKRPGLFSLSSNVFVAAQLIYKSRAAAVPKCQS